MAQDSQSAGAHRQEPLEYCSVSLSLAKTSAFCNIAPVLAPAAPRIVQIPIVHLDNPARSPFTVSVDLQSKSKTIHIGNLTAYPADRTGSFAMRVNTAFEEFAHQQGDALDKANLVFEMKLLPGTKRPDRLAIEIGPLRWLYEEPR